VALQNSCIASVSVVRALAAVTAPAERWPAPAGYDPADRRCCHVAEPAYAVALSRCCLRRVVSRRARAQPKPRTPVTHLRTPRHPHARYGCCKLSRCARAAAVSRCGARLGRMPRSVLAMCWHVLRQGALCAPLPLPLEDAEPLRLSLPRAASDQ
jgi:hypothetical protein